MRRAAIICFLLALAAGCGVAEKKSLQQFLDAVAASISHRYDDQLKDVPGPER